MSDTAPISKDWACPDCKKRTRKGDNTPVKVVCGGVTQDLAPAAATTAPAQVTTAAAPAQVSTAAQVTTAAQASASASALPAELATASLANVALDAAAAARGVDLLRRELAEYAAEMRDFRREMAEQRVIVAGVNARLEGLERRLEEVERRENAPAAPASDGVVAELERTVESLKRELDDRDQDALLSDLEIGHLPEENGESVGHAVIVLATKLGVKLEERDIVFAERVGRDSSGGVAPRVRRIVVRLARRSLRDELLSAARVRRTLTAADAGSSQAAPPGRIFVNERLTRNNRQLFHRVREECRRLRWRYSWTKRGRIYARRSDGEPVHLIRSADDVGRVFGTGSV